MPPRSNPTVRQARLGAELRKLREAAGMAAREAGAFLGGNQAQISHIEAGRWGVSAERVRRLATLYSASDARLVDALCAMADERVKGWWEDYQGVLAPGFLHLAELEHHARYLRSLNVVNVPGILQTEEYIRAIHRSYRPVLPAEDVDARVTFRLRRRSIFERDAPPPFHAIIHEAALRMRFGGRKIAKEQLDYVLEASERPTVTVRVLPFTCEEFIEATDAPLYAGGVVPQLDTVQLDSPMGSFFLGGEAKLNRYRQLLDIAERMTLNESESRRLIHHIAREL
ncbi:helix-turn-helix domain-containing protein [Streptomyces sp. KM273126]|uniref:helix-turn-helix domain-containing protein n=1 Tax=Streptomyces sp. KM273126 TaxID=2545247 RepID=UPI0010386FBA|nr:helix-turn-helix transcriptional regulator [Streptomyces sp. KM273126]MBA2807160.1 helix-turn-helix domain-containing protein [Streptomyces sp. KM273126]